jgi:hypothetical protein
MIRCLAHYSPAESRLGYKIVGSCFGACGVDEPHYHSGFYMAPGGYGHAVYRPGWWTVAYPPIRAMDPDNYGPLAVFRDIPSALEFLAGVRDESFTITAQDRLRLVEEALDLPWKVGPLYLWEVTYEPSALRRLWSPADPQGLTDLPPGTECAGAVSLVRRVELTRARIAEALGYTLPAR